MDGLTGLLTRGGGLTRKETGASLSGQAGDSHPSDSGADKRVHRTVWPHG